jgi:hypothetical protein
MGCILGGIFDFFGCSWLFATAAAGILCLTCAVCLNLKFRQRLMI